MSNITVKGKVIDSKSTTIKLQHFLNINEEKAFSKMMLMMPKLNENTSDLKNETNTISIESNCLSPQSTSSFSSNTTMSSSINHKLMTNSMSNTSISTAPAVNNINDDSNKPNVCSTFEPHYWRFVFENFITILSNKKYLINLS